MRLKEVSIKQPNAYKLYKFWKDRKIVKDSRQFITVRDLYTFFDQYKIWIEVSPEYDFGKSEIKPNEWMFTINSGIKLENQFCNNKTYYSRPVCEVEAFYKAFELLEKQIKYEKSK